jgi:hypothetical protein
LRKRFAAVAISASAALAAATPVVAPPVAATAVAGTSSNWQVVAFYRMNEDRGTVMHDSSPNVMNGSIGSDVRLNGRFFHFPHVPHLTYRPTHPSRVDSVKVNPGADTFRVTWRFRLHTDSTHVFSPNFMQKGQGWPQGGMFKFSNRRGKVSCLFRDSERQAGVSTTSGFIDDRWHIAACTRYAGSDPRVEVQVDGKTLGVKNERIGLIDNSWPLAIGGNTSCNGNQGPTPHHCNYWQGDMDWVRIERIAGN